MNIPYSLDDFSLLTAGIVFVAYVIVDALYAYYTLAVAEKQPLRAATIGTLIHFLLAVGILSFIQNFLYLIPLILGSWIGTYLAVTHAKK